MPLPQDFSPWEHLQSTIMRVHNEFVNEEFRDLGDDDDINVPRGSLRVACRMRDDDSADMTLIRMWLLMGYLRRARDFHPPMYFQPVEPYQADVVFRPQVKLFFEQDFGSIPDDEKPVRSAISFRLVNETSQSLTKAEMGNLARAIKREMGPSNGFRFSRGKKRFCYLDRERGYDFRLHVISESEAREVISKVLQIRNHTPDWTDLKEIVTNKTFPENPGTQIILGKARRKPRKRPSATVRFQYAQIMVHGLFHPINLYDRSGVLLDPLEKD
jgi:hypothetical protein